MNICNITQCMNHHCIYQRDNVCTIDETVINELGFCENSMCVDIPDSELERYKREHLELLRERYENGL